MAVDKTNRRRVLMGVWGMMLVLGGLLPSCWSAPSSNPKSSWTREKVRGSDDPTVLSSSCDPATGRCWGYMPIVDSRFDDNPVKPDAAYDRRQPIHARNVDQSADLWRDQTPFVPVGELNGRAIKKDVFTSRGWGAGGMPFSVLYMSPRAHNQQDQNKSDESRKNGDSVPAGRGSGSQSNYKVALRNGNIVQQRRHYSIIPQLFISYGWGPAGK